MASSRHAGPAGPCLFGRCASARHQGERTSTSRQTCCPLRFPRCAGSSGVSSGQGRPTPVASSLGRTGDDDTSSAPDDHTGPAEPELINPGCSTNASTDRLAAAHIDLRPLIIPIRSRVDPLEFGQGTRELTKGPLEPDFQRVDVHKFQLRPAAGFTGATNSGDCLCDHSGRTAVFDVVRDQFTLQCVIEGKLPTSPQEYGGSA